jgi:hypothetical protein
MLPMSASLYTDRFGNGSGTGYSYDGGDGYGSGYSGGFGHHYCYNDGHGYGYGAAFDTNFGYSGTNIGLNRDINKNKQAPRGT